MATLDEETQKELNDAEAVVLMTESAGWKLVKAKLDQRILDLQNMANLDRSKPLEAQIDGRMAAAEIFYAWLKEDIYGFIEQQTVNSQNLRDKETDGYIEQHTV